MPGVGKNLLSIHPVLDTAHHSKNGNSTDITINGHFNCVGMSSAMRQKTVGLRLFADVDDSVYEGGEETTVMGSPVEEL